MNFPKRETLATIILIFGAAFNAFSAAMYIFTSSDPRWFSRSALAFVCLGLWVICRKLDRIGITIAIANKRGERK